MINLLSFPNLGYQRIVIWYTSTDSFRTFSGYGYGGERPTIVLGSTHVVIGECYMPRCHSDEEYAALCGKLLHMMQGEVWSPRGEARDVIGNSGSAHTSMSIGDIAQIGERFFICADFASGFEEVTDRITVDAQ